MVWRTRGSAYFVPYPAQQLVKRVKKMQPFLCDTPQVYRRIGEASKRCEVQQKLADVHLYTVGV